MNRKYFIHVAEKVHDNRGRSMRNFGLHKLQAELSGGFGHPILHFILVIVNTNSSLISIFNRKSLSNRYRHVSTERKRISAVNSLEMGKLCRSD